MLTIASGYSQKKETIQWMDFEEAEQLYKQNGKPLFIDMYTTWCGYCKKMDAETFADPKIVEYVNAYFNPVKFNAETKDPISYKDSVYTNNRNGKTDIVGNPIKGKSHSLAEYLLNGRMAYPTVVYLVPDKDIVAPVPGYMTPQKLEPYLLFFSQKVYNKNLFEAFTEGMKTKPILDK